MVGRTGDASPVSPAVATPLRVTHGRSSVLLWRQCNMLCISGFVNNVMFFTYKYRPTANYSLSLNRWSHGGGGDGEVYYYQQLPSSFCYT